MDPSQRGALLLVWLIGGLFVVATIFGLGLYWAKCAFSQPPLPVQAFPCLLRLLPAAIGVWILIKARALAEWISNILDQ
jgi:hypothetical protein